MKHMNKQKEAERSIKGIKTHIKDKIATLNWYISSGKTHTRSDENMFSAEDIQKLSQLRNGLLGVLEEPEDLVALVQRIILSEETFASCQIPFILVAKDYHVFDEQKKIINQLMGISVSYVEIPDETYQAVFFVGDQPELTQEYLDTLRKIQA
jgi:hypothetical protein